MGWLSGTRFKLIFTSIDLQGLNSLSGRNYWPILPSLQCSNAIFPQLYICQNIQIVVKDRPQARLRKSGKLIFPIVLTSYRFLLTLYCKYFYVVLPASINSYFISISISAFHIFHPNVELSD